MKFLLRLAPFPLLILVASSTALAQVQVNPLRLQAPPANFTALPLPPGSVLTGMPISYQGFSQHSQLLADGTRISQKTEAQDREDSEEREKEQIKHLPEIARYWLTEDVGYIISPQEQRVFLSLATNQEREQFIVQFWSRRAPNPRSLTNTFEQNHYERIAFADENFGTRIPGFETDRGRIYVAFGPPDSIDSHRKVQKIGRGPEDGVGAYRYSTEVWHYKHVEGVGDNVAFEFVDRSGSRDYRLPAPLEMEINGRLIRMPPIPGLPRRQETNPGSASRSILYIGAVPTPLVQFRDLEVTLNSHISLEQVYFNYRIEFARATHATTLARILIHTPGDGLASKNNRGNLSTGFEVFGRISEPSGWIADTFEGKVNREGQCNSGPAEQDCEFNMRIAPGTYRLAIAVKNVFNGEAGTLYTTISVPAYDEISVAKPAE